MSAGPHAPRSSGPATETYLSEANTIIRYLLASWRKVLPGVSFAILRSVILAPVPWLFRVIIDQHVPAASIGGIFSVSLIVIGMLCVFFVFAITGARAMGRAMTNMTLELRSRIYQKLQFLSFGYLDQQHTGRLLSKYAFDTQKVEGALMQILNQFIPNILYSLVMLSLLVILEWRLALVVIFILPVYTFSRLYFFTKFRRHHHRARRAQETLTGTASELISALRLVRSYGEEKRAESQLEQSSSTLAQSRFELISANQIYTAFTQISTQILSLITVAGGALLVIHGDLTIGTLFAFIASLGVIVAPLQILGQVTESYFLGQESYQSIKELLDSRYVDEWKGSVKIPNYRGDVEFDNVSFRYRADGPVVVHDFSLRIKPGENVAFCGPSGSGKSTLANLLLGLYKPTAGVIRIDGHPQEVINMRWLRRRCAIVMQESLLLSGSVAENIRFARHNATDEEVRQAAREANAEEFILQMPFGFDTVVGERGATLSGGQRQRLSIARAILRNPQILILDEATSALDYESERLIQDALERLARGRTVITIAHRLSTIRNADRIVVLDAGRIVEVGSFDELRRSDGYFSRLLDSQDAEPVQDTSTAPGELARQAMERDTGDEEF